MLVYNIFVILWGAVVRATGSGAGCGSHWPLCNGEIIPTPEQIETLIEFGHRLTSGLSLILVVVLLIWAFRAYSKGHPARLGASLAMGFIVVEALIGAGLVLLELVGENSSTMRAIWISFHLINTFLLLAGLTLTALWGKTGRTLSFENRGMISILVGIGLGGMLVLGVSGAIAALGDTLFPVTSLQEGIAQDLSPTAHFLIQLRLIHPFLALGVAGYWIVSAGVIAALSESPRARRVSKYITIMWFAQLGIGLLNVYLLAPVWMQVVHLLMADIIWIMLILFAARVLEKPEPTETIQFVTPEPEESPA